MDSQHSPPRANRPVDHLANERTFLAWIRTSLGIMAFGFVVEKFALFVKQVLYFFSYRESGVAQLPPLLDHPYSRFFGIILIALGGLIGFFSYLNFIKVSKQIQEDCYLPSKTLGIVLTVLLVFTAIFLMLYLFYT